MRVHLSGLAATALAALAGVVRADEFTAEARFADDAHRSLTGAIESIATERNSRACGHVIATASRNDLNYVINAMIQAVGANFNSGGAFPLEFDDYYGIFLEAVGRVSDPDPLYEAEYGIKAVKVCGTCGEFKPKDKVKRAAYEQYCGKGVYGRDATFSGVALLPVDPVTMKVKGGALKGLISSISLQTDAFQTMSVKWPSDDMMGLPVMLTDVGFYVNALPAMMAAATGQYVGLIMDYMGYGESSDCFKGINVKKAYKTPVLPLYYATQDIVARLSHCHSQLVDKVVLNGQSEGGNAALAMAEALESVGVKILLVQAGTPADVDKAISKTIKDVIDSKLNPRFAYTTPMIGSSFSSSRPDVANFGIPGQGVLSDGERARMVNWAQANLELADLRLLTTNALNFSEPSSAMSLNTGVYNPAAVDSVKNTGDMCSNPAGLEALCAAIDENQILPSLTSVYYPVEICHSPFDDLIPFNNYTAIGNPRVTMKPPTQRFIDVYMPPFQNLYVHAATLFSCLVMQGWTAVDEATKVEMSGKCEMNGRSKKKSKKKSKKMKKKKMKSQHW